MFWISVVDGASFEAAQSDAAAQNMATGQGKIPHSAQPMVSLSAKAGWALTAGADLHLSADDHITLASGQHMDWAAGWPYRLHRGQSIGALAGVIQPGAVLANLNDSQPNVLQIHCPSDCHARVAKHLVWASQHWIEAAASAPAGAWTIPAKWLPCRPTSGKTLRPERPLKKHE